MTDKMQVFNSQMSYYALNYFFHLQKVLNVYRNTYIYPMYNDRNLKLRKW